MKPIFLNTIKTSIVAVAILAVSAFNPALAGDGGSSGGVHYPSNVIGVFVGATDSGKTDFTVGVEYERRVSEMFGFGGVIEHTPDAHNGDGVSVALVELFVHPVGRWRVIGGVGAEKLHGDSGYTKTIFRTGIAYDFIVGDFEIAPTFNVDHVDGKQLTVFGVSFLRHF
ncbi:MAG: hypothetical protein L3J04_04850 [Robiginitomaculum sp.]|nr:hypothetical protein [Robiginitomaculum sp.]